MAHASGPDQEALALAYSMRWLVADNKSDMSQAYANLLSASGGRDVHSLLLTSCHAGEGKTSAAIGLAYSVGKFTNQKVLLVDGNGAKPALHRAFGTPLSGGLTDVIYCGADAHDCIRQTTLVNVSIMTRGDAPERFSEDDHEELAPGAGDPGAESGTIYHSRAFSALLDQLKGEFGLVLFDGPSLLASSETAWAWPHFDGVLLVIACEDTKWEVAHLAQEKLEAAGGVLLGAVLNRRKYYLPTILYKNL